MTTVGGANRTDCEFTVANKYHGTRLEVDQIGWVYVETEVPVETVGTSESGNLELFSRGTQPRP